jgi:hypothetical protein
MKFIWREKLGRKECPYIIRWGIDFGLFSIRLHHWISSDDQRHLHDHGWSYWSFILIGGYTDISPSKRITLSGGDIIFRQAEHRHKVLVNKNGCWSFLITGPERKQWGFYVNGRFRKRNKYFYMFGHHPCE